MNELILDGELICNWCEEEIEENKFHIIRSRNGTSTINNGINDEPYLIFHIECFKHFILERELQYNDTLYRKEDLQ